VAFHPEAASQAANDAQGDVDEQPENLGVGIAVRQIFCVDVQICGWFN